MVRRTACSELVVLFSVLYSASGAWHLIWSAQFQIPLSLTVFFVDIFFVLANSDETITLTLVVAAIMRLIGFSLCWNVFNFILIKFFPPLVPWIIRYWIQFTSGAFCNLIKVHFTTHTTNNIMDGGFFVLCYAGIQMENKPSLGYLRFVVYKLFLTQIICLLIRNSLSYPFLR